MSLQLAAQHLSNYGRGNDSKLVHMSPREVNSLNALAQAHGGRLTINPHTGLPEAGFLDKLLPTLIGGAVSYFSDGLISPAMIGLGVGGIEALRSGSLEKGLMAGLGAYGGAGLTAGVMDAGTAAIGQEAASSAVQQAPTFAGDAAGDAARAQYYNTAVADKMAGASDFDKLSAGFKNPGKVVDAMGGGWNTAKYAAGAAAPYLADTLKPNTPMPDPMALQKPTEYRQYKVKRRPDGSYEYTALPVSTTFTPNFAEGGGVSELVNPYLDPNFKFRNVGGPPRVQTTTEMPTQRMAEGGRITPEEFYSQYMQQEKNPVNLKYGAQGYADTAPTTVTNPYERTQPTPADIIGVDGETYTWDASLGRYVVKPSSKIATTPAATTEDTKTMSGSITGSGDVTGKTQENTNKFFDNMTAEQQAQHEAQLSAISEGLTPMAVKVLQAIKNQILFKPPNEPIAPEVDMSTMSEAMQAQQDAAIQAALQNNAENAPTVTNNPAALMGDNSQGDAGGIGIGLGGNNAATVGTTGGTSTSSGSPMGGMGNGANAASVGLGFGAGSAGGLGTGAAMGIGASGGVSAAGAGAAGYATGGLSSAYNLNPYADGGPIDGNPTHLPLNENDRYPGSYMHHYMYGNTAAQPFSQDVVDGSTDALMSPMTRKGYASGGGASQYEYNLGSYSDGGRLLRGPGDGVSDSIPAMIGKKQPARLADGEFVVPARIVSEIGNGSTEAGARKLYAMMDRIQQARAQTVGKGKIAKNTRADKYLPV